MRGGEPALEAARAAQASARTIDLDSVRLCAPLPVPVQMRDCLTFEKHLRQCRSTMSKINPEARDLEPEEGCCQKNTNQYQFSSNINLLGSAETTPLGKSDGAIKFDIRPDLEMSVLIEKVADQGVDRDEFL